MSKSVLNEPAQLVGESLFRAIIESSEDAIIGVDPHGIVVSWNHAAQKMFGYSREEMEGKSAWLLTPEPNRHETIDRITQIQRDGLPHRYDAKRLHKDGTLVDVSIVGFPVRNAAGEIQGACAILRDNTPIRAREAKLHQSNEELEMRVKERTQALEEANQQLRSLLTEKERAETELERARRSAELASNIKSNFMANMSHEIRTPLAAILGYAEMMYDSRQTVAERLTCIGRIRQNIKNLTDLLEDILDLSRVESGHMEITPITFSLLPELGNITGALQSQAWKKRLHFDLRFQGKIPETITTDPKRFRQILIQIASNAINFTERGGVTITVKFEEEKLTFLVSDTGSGITLEQQQKLFEPYIEEDTLLSRPELPSGLGLVLARRLARTLGGDVYLEKTQPGRGSTFVFTLAVGNLVGVPFLENVTEADLNLHLPSSERPARKLDGMRVLLVEDAPDIQLLVSHFLRRNGATVEVAENGFEGIKKAKSSHYDVVLMDLQMPLLNGFDATAQLHRDGVKSPVVALTAHAMKGVREKCLEVGCVDYLTKPINASALLEKVGQFQRTSRQH